MVVCHGSVGKTILAISVTVLLTAIVEHLGYVKLIKKSLGPINVFFLTKSVHNRVKREQCKNELIHICLKDCNNWLLEKYPMQLIYL